MGVDFLSQFDEVITTRLHGHILSLLMDIPSVMIDNNYGKNSRFYDAWLEETTGSTLAKNGKELDQYLETKEITF